MQSYKNACHLERMQYMLGIMQFIIIIFFISSQSF